MLTQKAKYALRALLYIAGKPPGSHPTIAEIAEHRQVPHKFLELILGELREAGLVMSRRGRNGGYALAQGSDTISVGAIVRLMDGPLAPISCASLTAYRRCADCEDEATCAIRLVMRQVRDATSAILDRTMLADLAGQADPLLPAAGAQPQDALK
jgi:Rrf2 family protein